MIPRKVKSLWRLRSREVIRLALAALSPDSSLAEKKQALRGAYPFGERRLLPYKHWCREVRDALRSPTYPRPEPMVRATRLGVVCGWCASRGCPACFDARRRGVSAEARATLTRLLGAGAPVGVVQDFLKECELDDYADRLPAAAAKKGRGLAAFLAPFHDYQPPLEGKRS